MKKLIVIIAGYPDQLDKYFFSFNPGLSRRFPYKFKIEGYTPDELRDIFIDKLRKFKWKLSDEVTIEKLNMFFNKNKEEFPNYGGDIENLFKSCQLSHSKRMIGRHPMFRGKLTMDDIEKGYEKFTQNKRNNNNNNKTKYGHMYLWLYI